MNHLFIALLISSTIASSDAAGFGDAARPYWRAHGALMFLSWAVIFPVGALLAVYRRYVGKKGKVLRCFPHFYLPHFYFQVLGVVLNVVAVALAWRGSVLEYDTGNPFDDVLWNYESDRYPWNRHVKWGVTVVFLMVSIGEPASHKYFFDLTNTFVLLRRKNSFFNLFWDTFITL